VATHDRKEEERRTIEETAFLTSAQKKSTASVKIAAKSSLNGCIQYQAKRRETKGTGGVSVPY